MGDGNRKILLYRGFFLPLCELQFFDKLIRRYTSLLQDPRQSPNPYFFMIRDYTSGRAASQNNVAALLTGYGKPEFLKCRYALSSTDSRKSRHGLPQR